jgi:hypothetical protein
VFVVCVALKGPRVECGGLASTQHLPRSVTDVPASRLNCAGGGWPHQTTSFRPTTTAHHSSTE